MCPRLRKRENKTHISISLMLMQDIGRVRFLEVTFAVAGSRSREERYTGKLRWRINCCGGSACGGVGEGGGENYGACMWQNKVSQQAAGTPEEAMEHVVYCTQSVSVDLD